MKFSVPLLFILLALLLCGVPSLVEAATLARPANNLGLQAYWSFDQGTSTKMVDQSGKGHTVTFATTGGTLPTWITGRYGKAVTFDGSTNNGSCANCGDLSFPDTTFTVSYWQKETANGLGGFVVTNGAVGGGWGTRDDGSVFLKNVLNSQNLYTVSGAAQVTMRNGKWHHLVYIITTSTTVAANNTITFYIDGVLDSVSGTPTVTYTSNPNFTLASRGAGNYFAGSLDELRIYSRSLSTLEIKSLYQKGQAQTKITSRTGLVGEWLFEGSMSTAGLDTSGSGNTMTFSGSPVQTVGRHKKGILFTPTSHGAMSTVNNLPSSVITVSAWVKGTTNRNWNNIVAKNWTAVSGSWDLFTNVNGTASFGIFDTAQHGSNSTINLVPGKWYHVVGTYDGTTVQVYVNGVAGTPNTASAPSLDTSSTAFTVGYTDDGAMDDVRIYNRVLSLAEINALYREGSVAINTSQNNKLTNGLVGLWSFDGADIGTKVFDRSGNGFDGYLIGTNNATSSRKTIGKIGQAFSFGGTNTGSINLGNSTSLTPSRFTVAAWVYQNALGCYNYIYSNARDSGGTYNGIELNIYCGGQLSGSIWNSTNSNITGPAIPIRVWTHVAFTYDGSFKKLYVNGVQVASSAQTIDPATPASFNTYIGSMGNGSGSTYTLNGKLDETRLYNRALSAAEIKQLYLMGK